MRYCECGCGQPILSKRKETRFLPYHFKTTPEIYGTKKAPCAVCGKIFRKKQPFSKYCSVQCFRSVYKMHYNKLKCEFCQKIFLRPTYRGISKRTFCSLECSRKSVVGRNNPMWRGGKTKHSQGYTYVKMPNHPFSDHQGYIFEHRIIMEKKLNRFLQPHEVVHHIDGDRSNNRIENLQLFANNKLHTAHEHRVRPWSTKRTSA